MPSLERACVLWLRMGFLCLPTTLEEAAVAVSTVAIVTILFGLLNVFLPGWAFREGLWLLIIGAVGLVAGLTVRFFGRHKYAVPFVMVLAFVTGCAYIWNTVLLIIYEIRVHHDPWNEVIQWTIIVSTLIMAIENWLLTFFAYQVVREADYEGPKETTPLRDDKQADLLEKSEQQTPSKAPPGQLKSMGSAARDSKNVFNMAGKFVKSLNTGSPKSPKGPPGVDIVDPGKGSATAGQWSPMSPT